MAPALDRIRIGSAPDSWGVRFPDDPLQVPWERFLDEVAEAGCSWTEPGPYGYRPTDPARLTDEVKQVDPGILAGVVEDGVPFGPAVRRGMMCEPPTGVPDLEPVLVAAQGLGVELFAIVEQDMYPCEPDRPLPTAVRTRDFPRSRGA
ncbi:hypothetical protein ACFW2D_16820 [Streptomyces sp. NPDC058914]|uniref:hypothetical protein n=1 Tax=Streptomyces sp. NPDC058914 TaxID=3346671 RepID=UPI0036893382